MSAVPPFPPSDLPRSRAAALARAISRASVLALLCVTCDAPTALESPEVRDIALAWAADSVLVAGSSAPAAVTVTVDGQPYADPRFRLTSSDTSVIAIADDGRTLVARRLGRATVTVQLLSTVLSAEASRLAQPLSVAPKDVLLASETDTLFSLGDTLRLSASALDAADQELAIPLTVWESSDTLVATVRTTGLVTARGNGQAEITADVGGRRATATVVVHQRAAQLVLSTALVRLDALGADTLLSAEAVDARGNALGVDAPAIGWQSASAAVATVVEGRLVAVDNGGTWIRVTAGPLADSVRVEVAQRADRVVMETPAPLSLRALGETASLRARAYDRRGNELTAGLPFWRSDNAGVAHVDSRTGIVTAIAVGAATVTAEVDTARAGIAVAVTNPPAYLEIIPSAASLTSIGDTLPLRAVARNALGVIIPDVTPTWRSTDSAIALVLPDGRLIAAGVGSARVIAQSDAVADTVLVTVANTVDRVIIVPASATLASVGDTLIPEVQVLNARNMELGRGAALWSSDDPAVARVTAMGVVIAMGQGDVYIRAASPTYPDRRDSVLVAVTNAPASVAINRAADTLTAVGQTRTYIAEVRNARGALLGVIPSWRSTVLPVASVSPSGVVTAAAVGATRVIAAAGTVADTLDLLVRDDVVWLEAAPSTITLGSVNDTARLSATGRNALGGFVAAPVVTWTSTDPSIVLSLGDGRIVAMAAGTARIIVTGGTLADTVTATVTNAPVFVDIVPVEDTLYAIGDSLPVDVVVRNARGDLLPRTAVSWSSDDAVVARVSTSGTVTARDTGSTWVRATGVNVRDSVRMIVRNDAASIAVSLAGGAPAALDTLTAPGQSLSYAAVVRNRLGLLVPDAMIAWTSTAPGVVTTTASGTATAAGFGSALLIASAGQVADTVRLVVRHPTLLHVDNGVVASPRLGTLARPFATVQDAVDAAAAGDTVFVHRGLGYSEAVTLGRRIALVGDSSAFVSGGRDPLLLPRIAHDLGAAGIAAATAGASYTIRYLAIQHSVDGEAIAIRDAENVLIEHVHVNPAAGFRSGRGILVTGALGSAAVLRSRVDSVNGFGVRVHNSAGARVEGSAVNGVGARAGYSGAGMEIVGGSGAIVTGATVRRTAGPQLLLDGTTDAALLASTLTGEQQLARLTGVLGTTTVRGNTFDMRRQAGDPLPVRGGAERDPSGLEVVASAGVLVDANVFTDIDGRTSLMDGLRLLDVRAATGGAGFGARLTANRFGGGRTAVRSERASWSMSGSRADSAGIAIRLAEADSVALDADTLSNARIAAVQSTGAGASLVLTRNVIAGPERALVVTGAARVTARRNTIAGATGASAAQPLLGAIDVDAASAEIVDNTVRGVRGWAAIALRSATARADSNFITRNLVGVRLVGGAASLQHNAIFDNDTLALGTQRSPRGLVNDGAATSVGANWWGDARGPQRAGKSQYTPGDSILGSVTYDSLAAPIATHAGVGIVGAMHKLAGDAQTGLISLPLALPFSVRVVDNAGRPLAGVAVTFRADEGDIIGGTRIGGDSQRIVTTDASGIAEVVLVQGTKRGTYPTTATAGSLSLTFTSTVP